MSRAEAIARRGFLKGLGATLALPWLPSLARADGVKPTSTVRFVAVFTANGQQLANYWPETDPQWSVLDGTEHVREAPLSALPGPGLSKVLGPAFDAVREKLLLVRGLDFVPADAFGHWPSSMLSGWSRLGELHETLDQVLARSKSVYPTPQRIPVLNQFVPSPQPYEGSISVSAVGGISSNVTGFRDARRVFELLFEDLGPTLRASDAARARRKWVMDRVLEDYREVATSQRLSANDRQRLDAHATHLHELQQQLERPQADLAWCTPEVAPELLPHEEVELPQIVADHIEVMAAAVRCGLTRVATLQLCDSRDIRTLPFTDAGPFYGGHHQLTHELDNRFDPELALLNRWYGDQVARLILRLDEMVEDPETGTTVLDNCLVYWGNEYGCNPVHESNAMPVLLAGGAGGQLRTGRYLDYRKHGLRFDILPDEVDTIYTDPGPMFDWRGRPYNELLVTILQAMGLSPDEYEFDESGGFGDYSSNQFSMYHFGDRRSWLPGIRA